MLELAPAGSDTVPPVVSLVPESPVLLPLEVEVLEVEVLDAEVLEVEVLEVEVTDVPTEDCPPRPDSAPPVPSDATVPPIGIPDNWPSRPALADGGPAM